MKRTDRLWLQANLTYEDVIIKGFLLSLKTEWVVFEDYKTRSEARSSVFSYIELFIIVGAGIHS